MMKGTETKWEECAALERLPDPATYPYAEIKVLVYSTLPLRLLDGEAVPVRYMHVQDRTLYRFKKGCVIRGQPYYVFGWAEKETE